MIDIHSHIIFGVDDGPDTLDESLRMLAEAEKLGIKVIIATPHYKNEPSNAGRMKENFYALKNKAADFGITLKTGSEIFIYPLLEVDLKRKNAITLDDSSFVLVEFPNTWIPAYTRDLIYNLQIEGIDTIIAHPERSRYFSQNVDFFKSYFERGCLIQFDAASILGLYGRRVKRFVKKAIKSDMAHFVASDAHCADDYSQWYLQAFEKVRRWVGETNAENLFLNNAKEILSSSINTQKKDLCSEDLI